MYTIFWQTLVEGCNRITNLGHKCVCVCVGGGGGGAKSWRKRLKLVYKYSFLNFLVDFYD